MPGEPSTVMSLWRQVRATLGTRALTLDEWLAIADFLPRPLTDNPIRRRRAAKR